ncbi:MAG: hypothetical protein MUD14_13340 [Hydrococcus sp. Prado102]|nr:hypothetical protein [Hydrococcus sp. Prado102]
MLSILSFLPLRLCATATSPSTPPQYGDTGTSKGRATPTPSVPPLREKL